MTTRDAGKALCLATAISCVLLHAATFLTVVPGLLILVPFFLLMGAALCTRVTQGWFPSYRRVRTSAPRGKNCHSWFVLAGLCDSPVFALLQEFGRSIERGNRCSHYVYMYKETVIRPISEEEYKMFPVQVTRMMSAWLAMIAMFCLSSLIDSRSGETSV